MNKSPKALPVVKTFSGTVRALAIAAINSDDKSQKTKRAFFDMLFVEGITPSKLVDHYKDDIKAIALSTFPKKVQDAVTSKLIRKDDIVKGVKSDLGKLLKKVDWQNQINKKATRLTEGYTAYIARHHDKVEVAGTLQPIAVDAMGRAVRLPKAEKPLAVKTVEDAYVKQAAWSNIKSPTTLEVEMAKDYMRILDRAKSMSVEARVRFNQLSAPKASGAKKQVTAKAKAKK